VSNTLVGLGSRSVVASVWAYNGAWCKVAGRDPGHRRITGRIPRVPGAAARPLTIVIGVLECGVAGWVLSGVRPVGVATVQSLAVVAMNTGCLAWAPDEIADRASLVRRSSAFLALVWATAWSMVRG